ncbi:helix-turn-helix transcriptional regulator [Micromonospora sp. Llam0]|uniref:helix-turn-helix domain-containing protein n=1 Tax=Micromonospora sp. Llam0 TaxID=2485143 RepID=UPI001F39BE35|nr:helix-turn-helix transcriptional regulator [Micromonospora sp. Llam0]
MPRRQLGRCLRDLRMQARFTVRAAADALEWSEAKIWRIETGQTSMRSLDVEQMCRVYGALTETTTSLMALAKETKSKGWWLSYSDVINEGFDVYIGLEESCRCLRWYEAELVPGLLQTEDYARTLIEADNPGMEPREIDRRVKLRIARQALLTRPVAAPELRMVLNESILRRPVGGQEVMSAQLERLVTVSEMPNVALRVLPFAVGMHAGIMSGPFAVLEFPTNGNGQATEPPTVYVDGFTGALFLDKPHEIDRYEGAFSNIWDASPDERASRQAIRDAMKEMDK